MAVVLVEKPERSGDTSPTSGSGRWNYVARVTGEATPETALINAIITDTGYFWYNLSVKKISFEELGGSLYSATVDWEYEVPGGAAQDPTDTPGPTDGPGGTAPSGTPSGPATATEPLGPNVSLEVGGRPPKLTQSLSVVDSEGLGVAAPDHGRLINLNRGTGEVEGLEVDDPASVLTVDILFDRLTMGYIDRLQAATWHKNDADWYHLPAGSVAFLGATFTTSDAGRWKGTFRFGLRPTETIGVGGIRVVGPAALPSAPLAKRGWDYLEIAYRNEEDATLGLTVSRPFAYWVHEILPDLDFTTLGIGGA